MSVRRLISVVLAAAAIVVVAPAAPAMAGWRAAPDEPGCSWSGNCDRRDAYRQMYWLTQGGQRNAVLVGIDMMFGPLMDQQSSAYGEMKQAIAEVWTDLNTTNEGKCVAEELLNFLKAKQVNNDAAKYFQQALSFGSEKKVYKYTGLDKARTTWVVSYVLKSGQEFLKVSKTIGTRNVATTYADNMMTCVAR